MPLLTAALAAATLSLPADTLRTIDLDEATAVATPKETVRLRQQAGSVNSLSAQLLERHQVQSIKDVSRLVPNLFMPEYGSHLTTAAYIRGVGSRINTPAVGLYVDNVPFADKSAFDFSLFDIERIDVLRGPQSTLYGRNAMGGLVRVYTKNPFHYRGTDVSVSSSFCGGPISAGVTRYQRVSDTFAFSAGANFLGRNGYFKNDARDGERIDDSNSVGARLRGIYRPSERVSLDFQANYDYTDEGGYPYFFAGWADATAHETDYFRSDLDGKEGSLAYNRRSSYRRHLLNLGINAEHRWDHMVLTNICGYQWLKDDMMMDQDFTALDIYTLQQKQQSSTISEEIALKSAPGAFDHWEWSGGINAFWQGLTTQAPVVFREDGVGWLNGVMNAAAGSHMPTVQAGPMTMAFQFNDHILDPELAMHGRYDTPNAGVALYHQSRVKDLFTPGLSLTLGARLDYEHQHLDYTSSYAFQHEYALGGHLTMPTMERDIPMVPAATYDVARTLMGDLSHGYLQFLPKASLMYEFGSSARSCSGNVYATASRGYRSGGYNIQMFSEVLQGLMRADMMSDVRDVTLPVLEAQPAVPAAAKEQVSTILTQMAAEPQYDIEALTLYRPEYAWNYEAGTHLNLFDRRLQLDLAAFYIDTRNQQVSRMSATGLGRVTVNAGRSHSKGLEASLLCRPFKALQMRLGYGFTSAKFAEYLTVDTRGQEADYSGNYVPFVPRHTLNAAVDYTWTFGAQHSVTAGLDYTGAGKIFWTESNSVAQPFYSLLGASLSVDLFDRLTFKAWAHNITGTHYNTFYFETMQRAFEQHGRPFDLGLGVKWHF